MSEKIEWSHGVLEAEFWAVYKGWKVFVRKGLFGWRWSIMRKGWSTGNWAEDRPAAEAAALTAVDRMVRQWTT